MTTPPEILRGDTVRKRNLYAIVFDYDGVIVESMRPQEIVWREAAGQIGLPEPQVEQLVGNLYKGRSGTQMFSGVELSPRLRDALRQRKDALWRQRYRCVRMVRGAAFGVRLLSRFCRLAIATSTQRSLVEDFLLQRKLLHCFDAIVQTSKPNKEVLLELVQSSLGSAREASVMVGDTEADQEMAAAARVPFVWFRPRCREGTQRQCATARTWEELTAWLLCRIDTARLRKGSSSVLCRCCLQTGHLR
ncbi:HAD family hydrolase [Candidatus Parcubacteria bacterium]|nr:MAG: HAD family hydrolase [Candidatus Parcubacteria bacterium]